MSELNAETRYTRDHEWVRLDGDTVTIGITNHAQEALGDVVFVELPEPGRVVVSTEACAVVESVKAASDVYAPLGGTISDTNPAIVEDPSLVNREAAGEGWFFKMIGIEAAEFQALLDKEAYEALLETL